MVRPKRLPEHVFCLIAGIVLLNVLLTSAYAQDELSREAYDILKKNCFSCHGAIKTGGLDLRTVEALKAGGDRGSVVVPHNPRDSRLFQLVSHAQQPNMPLGKKLTEEEIEVLRRWIEEGASLEGVEEALGGTRATVDAELLNIPERPITPEERSYWAFQKPRRPSVPQVADPRWSKNPIDAFLFTVMKNRGLQASPKADRRTLVRRAYLDLLGLPPSPQEIDEFMKDSSPDAWQRLVDRLLSSPHYGERWARHWLDLVRYADSGGFEFDNDRPDAWRYRDYVVNSLNSDKPYDRFIREQIAGDEYDPNSQEAMIATGFFRLGPEGGGGGERGRQDSLDDIIGTTSLAFMGLTVSCARCHDHKFDAISQKDYYRMQSIFFSTRNVSHPLVPPDVVAAHKSEMDRIERLQRPLKKAKSELEAPYLKQLVDAEIDKLPEYLRVAWNTPEDQRTEGQRLNVRQIEKTLTNDNLRGKITEKEILALMPEEERARHGKLKAKIEALEEEKPKPYATARAIGEFGREPRPSYFLHRGAVDLKGPQMTPGVLSAIGEAEWEFPAPPADAKSSWRRRGLAEWIAAPQNPLTARVMVNRIWQHHFGEGLVRTPSNFGKLGEPPSHPELLDWLAVEFVDSGWSMKHMHRLMMNSEAYQTASDDVAANIRIDPENRLFWRMPRLRLEAEIIRDNILAAAGTLDRTVGGPGVFPYINPDLFEASSKRNWPGQSDDDPSTWRRSVYVYSKRSIRYPLFEAFDQPNLINSVDVRNRSTVAPQALLLMNNAMVIRQSEYFSERLRREAGPEPDAQVEHAFHIALGRPPSEFEKARSVEFIRGDPEGLAEFCQLLFNLNEFVYRP